MTSKAASDPMSDHATLHTDTAYKSEANTFTESQTIPGSGGAGLTVGASGGTRTFVTDTTVTNYNSTEAEPYFQLHRDCGGAGKAGLNLGAGGATATDTNLYRSAANVLKTDDALVVAGDTLGVGDSATLFTKVSGKVLEVSNGVNLTGSYGLGLVGDNTFLPPDNTITFDERADADAPSADRAILYSRDNGAGKTQIVVRFPTGAVQVIATEP